MTTIFGTVSRALAAIALVSSLGACALSPGMTFKAGHLVDPNDPNSVSEVRELTPALVMDDVRARNALIDNDGVDRLYGKSEPYRIGPGHPFDRGLGPPRTRASDANLRHRRGGDRTSHWGHRLGHSGLCRISHWIHPVSVHGIAESGRVDGASGAQSHSQ